MTVRRNFLGWGIFLICVGAVPLAVQLGIIDSGAVSGLLRLWPLILIGIGLGLLLRLTPYAVIGGLIVAGTFGLFVGVAFAGGLPAAVAACGGGSLAGPPTVTRDGTIAANDIVLDIDINCADLDVSRVAGTTWHVDATAGDQPPRIDSDGSRLSLESAQRGWGLFGSDARERWSVSLPADAMLSAGITVSAATAHLDLGDGAISDLSATFNASDGRLDLSNNVGPGPQSVSMTLNASSLKLLLPNASMNAGITLNAASLDLCVAPAAGLSIDYTDALSSDNFDSAGLVKVGDGWQTPDFATAGSRIRLRLSSNVSSINLDRSGACQ